jgi:predicted PurR-regulated permease PerM
MAIFDRKTAQVLATILAFAAGLWLLWGLRDLAFLLIIAIFFAYTVEPLISLIYRHTPSNISRRTSIFVTFLFVLIATVAAGFVLGQMVTSQAAELIQQLPSLDEDPSHSTSIPLPSQLEPFRDEITHQGLDFARSVASGFLGSLGSAGFLLLAPIFALFFLLEGPSFRHKLVEIAARSGEQIWLTGLLDDLRNLLSNYIRALFLQSLSVFIGYALFYQMAQVPYAMLLASLAAVLEVIPVLGWISAGLLSMIVAGFVGYTHLLWMFAFYLIFRIFQDYVITPYVMQHGIELPAFLILTGVIAGEMLGGIRGMFLSIPLIAALRILYRHIAKRGLALSFILLASLAQAHSISVSTSEAKLEGKNLSLNIRLPRYEVEHLPEAGLAAAFRFTGTRLEASQCKPVENELLCELNYTFPELPSEKLEAQVTLARITVPNHVHIMKLSRGPVNRQAVFDRTFEQEQIDFHELARTEVWWRAARMGFTQLLYQPILVALLLILFLPLPYIAGATAAFLIVLPDKFYATPGFFELATAISLSYIAIEHLFFPKAEGKWIVAAVIGAIEGTALAILARPTGQGAVAFGAGNLIAALALSLFATRFSRNIPEPWSRRIFWAFSALGVIWSIWVFIRRF